MRCTAMAEDKEPERKKLSLQGNNKLSLGSTQEIIPNPRNSLSSGLRSVQVETRRKRVSRGGSFGKAISSSDGSNNKNTFSASGGLTEKEKEARFKALKQGLQDIDDKNINEILLSQNEVIKSDLPETKNKLKETYPYYS